jgi:hypothetical protein
MNYSENSTASATASASGPSLPATNSRPSGGWPRQGICASDSAPKSSGSARRVLNTATPTSSAPASSGGPNTSRPKQRYGYAKINAKDMDECRELYREERAKLRAYKNAYYDRIESLAKVKAFREKHGLDADTFQKYGSGRNGRRPLPE